MPAWLIKFLATTVRPYLKKHGWKGVLWIAQQIAPDQLRKVGNRQKAVKAAKATNDGKFAGLQLEGKLRYVVFSGDQPLESFPPVKGDLTKLLAHYNGHGMKRPDELTTAKAKRWVKAKLSFGKKAPPDEVPEIPADLAEEPVPSIGADKFAEIAGRLPELLENLTSQPAKPIREQNGVPATPGIYLFSEGPAPMYVGQTRNLKRRLRDHTAPTARENQASFAFRLAEEAADSEGLAVAGTRKDRAEDERFKELFRLARERVAAMNVQLLEMDDPIERTLFEVFVTEALNLGKYNDFETH